MHSRLALKVPAVAHWSHIRRKLSCARDGAGSAGIRFASVLAALLA
jgi:hypothetical protein